MEKLKKSTDWFKNYFEHIENKGTKDYLLSIFLRFIVFFLPTLLAIPEIGNFFTRNLWNIILLLVIVIILFVIQEFININKIFDEEANMREMHKKELADLEAEYSSLRVQLENENSTLHDDFEQLSIKFDSQSLQIEMYYGIIESNIKKFIFQLSKKLNLTNNERISLYRRDAVGADFIILTRYSLNPHFGEINRSSYPSDEGFISRCWGNDPVFYIDNMEVMPSNSDEFQEYYKKYYSDKNVKMSEDFLKSSKMKSRSFYVRNILSDNGEKTVGVIVIESTEPLIANFRTEKELTNALDEDPLVMPYLYYLMDNKLDS